MSKYYANQLNSTNISDLFLLLGNLLFMDLSDLKKNSILVHLSDLCRNSVQLFSFLSHIQKKADVSQFTD